MSPSVTAFFDETTHTVGYVAVDHATGAAAIIDSVLDFDPAAGRIATRSATRSPDSCVERGLTVERILETHVHADHVTAAPT